MAEPAVHLQNIGSRENGVASFYVRKSGTEPLVRIMVEAPTEAEAEAVTDRLATTIEQHLA